MSATAVETQRVVQALNAKLDAECPVCGGGWFSKDGERVGSVHHVECPRREADSNQDTRSA